MGCTYRLRKKMYYQIMFGDSKDPKKVLSHENVMRYITKTSSLIDEVTEIQFEEDQL